MKQSKSLRRGNIVVLLSIALLCGCVPLMPYRTVAPTVDLPTAIANANSAPCSIPAQAGELDVEGIVPDVCAHQIREDAANYNLYFSEYDDQGWSYPAGSSAYGGASEQTRYFVEGVQQLLKKKDERLSVVVFAHGWKHNAHSGDDNVKTFRKILFDLSRLEQVNNTRCRRRVVGLYVGWRGKTGMFGPLENLTFWNRKEAAQRVAQGDVRVLFSHMRTLQDNANTEWNVATEKARSASVQKSAEPRSGAAPDPAVSDVDPCLKRMRLSTAGHSFGGLIVYTSIAQALIRDVVELGHAEALQSDLPPAERVRPVLQREGDLVVVINPAIEATRLEPLQRAVVEAKLPHYHTPIFVSITSKDDVATRKAFPVGRWLSTRFDKYPEEPTLNEEEANLYTFGHARSFVTHELGLSVAAGTISEGSNLPCTGWSKDIPFEQRLAIEQRNLDSFRQELVGLKNNGASIVSRHFCGLQTMKLQAFAGTEAWSGNSPVWNVSTAKPIVNDHNDFDNPLLLEFLRQLYIEAEDRSVARLQLNRRP